jgi:hypothetical protein
MKLRSKFAVMLILVLSAMSFGTCFADNDYPEPKAAVTPPTDVVIVIK